MSTAALWDGLARPLDALRAAETLLGLSPSAARLLASALHATSPEADALLFGMPHLMRSLVIASTGAPQRTHGDVRGPIQWGETMSARAASAGDPMVFVCATPGRAYDAPENRVLVAALHSVRRAASAVEVGRLKQRDTALFHHIRSNGSNARRYLDHRSLSGVPRVKPTARELKRTRSGTRRRAYRPALMVLDRLGGFAGEDLELVTDDATAFEHETVLAVLEHLRARGHDLPALRLRNGVLTSGPVAYRHRRSRHPEVPPGLSLHGERFEVDSLDDIAAALDGLTI